MAMPNRLRSWGPPLAFIAVVSAVLLAIFPKGFPNYDTIYYLLWGREIADGLSPDYGAPLAPTPHPLYDLLGAVFSPLGDGSITVAVVLAYVSLGLLAWLVYRLGKEWFDRPIGFLAAFLVMTSAPVLSNGLRAYIDIPYMVLCLAALLIETRRPKAGWPVLALLALAGLLRPEAWLFAGFYFLWLALDVQIQPRIKLRLRESGIDRDLILMACLTAAGPVIWVLFDLITTSNPLYSFTGTRETVETLERDTGPLDVIVYGPRRLGEVMQWPGMVGAFFGVILTAWAMPKRAAIGIVAAALALVAFALMGASGLAIIPRYTMLAAAILFVFTAAAVLGWRLLEPGHKLRRIWQVAAAVTVALWLIWLPNQYDLLSTVDQDLSDQALVEKDLEKLVDSGAFYKPGTEEVRCLPISVPNHRAVPRLAFWLDIRPSEVVSTAAIGAGFGGLFLTPARPFTIEHFILDPGDETRVSSQAPEGSRLVAANRSWKLYSDCGWTGYAPLSEP
ncbi:MAG: glycosyltransferase family 39 protein [Solirubrobacterales bacterium]|nr:glycosyltransferase family 39 protein [Solirubrobacterales bacterium]OJU94577.1 MAG: hypothetical protein BGO23_04050 [Solirubrobacterales bacterium 67-14]